MLACERTFVIQYNCITYCCEFKTYVEEVIVTVSGFGPESPLLVGRYSIR